MGFKFYEHTAGYDWYQCDSCGALSIGRPRECPVCGGRGRASVPPQDTSRIDEALRRFQELIDKCSEEIGGKHDAG